MDTKLFDDLQASIKEAGRIMKGEAAASRRFVVTGPDVKSQREHSGLFAGGVCPLDSRRVKICKIGSKAVVALLAQLPRLFA